MNVQMNHKEHREQRSRRAFRVSVIAIVEFYVYACDLVMYF